MIFALWGRFLALPPGIRNLIGGALALVVAALLFLWWLDKHTDAAVNASIAADRATIVPRQAGADAAAMATKEALPAQIERDNARAKAVASGSADPLRDGLNALGKRP